MEFKALVGEETALWLMRQNWPSDGLLVEIKSIEDSGAIEMEIIENKEARTSTKFEYVKVKYNHAWEVVKLKEDGVELFKTNSDDHPIERINSIALRAQDGYDFYQRIEITITKRDEFIDKAFEISGHSTPSLAIDQFGKLYDAGCRFAGE